MLGAEFGEELMATAREAGVDEFGECGEFHSVACVWEVTREAALYGTRGSLS